MLKLPKLDMNTTIKWTGKKTFTAIVEKSNGTTYEYQIAMSKKPWGYDVAKAETAAKSLAYRNNFFGMTASLVRNILGYQNEGDVIAIFSRITPYSVDADASDPVEYMTGSFPFKTYPELHKHNEIVSELIKMREAIISKAPLTYQGHDDFLKSWKKNCKDSNNQFSRVLYAFTASSLNNLNRAGAKTAIKHLSPTENDDLLAWNFRRALMFAENSPIYELSKPESQRVLPARSIIAAISPEIRKKISLIPDEKTRLDLNVRLDEMEEASVKAYQSKHVKSLIEDVALSLEVLKEQLEDRGEMTPST